MKARKSKWRQVDGKNKINMEEENKTYRQNKRSKQDHIRGEREKKGETRRVSGDVEGRRGQREEEKRQAKDDHGEEKGNEQGLRRLTAGWAGKGLYWSTGSMLELVTCVTEGSWNTTKHVSFFIISQSANHHKYIYRNQTSITLHPLSSNTKEAWIHCISGITVIECGTFQHWTVSLTIRPATGKVWRGYQQISSVLFLGI